MWVGDVGGELPHWEGVERIPPQGGRQADGKATLAREGLLVGISPSVGRNGGGGTAGGGDLRLPPLENGRTLYCDQDHYVNRE